jgi:hypothetical protein
MSTPTTSNPAILYPVAAPPAQQNKSSSLGIRPKTATASASVRLSADRIPLFEITLSVVASALTVRIPSMFSLYSLSALGKLVYFSLTLDKYQKRNGVTAELSSVIM